MRDEDTYFWLWFGAGVSGMIVFGVIVYGMAALVATY